MKQVSSALLPTHDVTGIKINTTLRILNLQTIPFVIITEVCR